MSICNLLEIKNITVHINKRKADRDSWDFWDLIRIMGKEKTKVLWWDSVSTCKLLEIKNIVVYIHGKRKVKSKK